MNEWMLLIALFVAGLMNGVLLYKMINKHRQLEQENIRQKVIYENIKNKLEASHEINEMVDRLDRDDVISKLREKG